MEVPQVLYRTWYYSSRVVQDLKQFSCLCGAFYEDVEIVLCQCIGINSEEICQDLKLGMFSAPKKPVSCEGRSSMRLWPIATERRKVLCRAAAINCPLKEMCERGRFCGASHSPSPLTRLDQEAIC